MTDDFEEWLAHGIEQGWISEGHCDTHDMLPMTDAEEDLAEQGKLTVAEVPLVDAEVDEFATGDPCIPVLRVWGPGGRAAVEAMYAPADEEG